VLHDCGLALVYSPSSSLEDPCVLLSWQPGRLEASLLDDSRPVQNPLDTTTVRC
jgi:hypothetical protein